MYQTKTFQDASKEEIEKIACKSAEAFKLFKNTPAQVRATLLRDIANEIESLGDELINLAHQETNLPAPRLIGERGRTTGQLRMFAEMLEEGSWVEAMIDTAIPEKNPPRPDIRRMLVPLGPIVVFGASNFPFAYSTAGGDTASALAAGCPVIIKGHPAHSGTSHFVFEAMQKALSKNNLSDSIIQHVHGTGFETGKILVQQPEIAAVGFTGSFNGGKALLDYVHQRTHLIPVFAEMGSVNPMVFLPDTLARNHSQLAIQTAASIVLGMGQFCTNPGLLFGIQGPGLDAFLQALGNEFEKSIPAEMLHQGIHHAFLSKLEKALNQKGVSLVGKSVTKPLELQAWPTLATVDGQTFLENPMLYEEVFGPYSLMVNCKDAEELFECWKAVKGQLTTTFMGTEQDFNHYRSMITEAQEIAGRIIFNGVPTGVEVCRSMVHGGPYPASTDSRFSAVGVTSVKRWTRPVCFQNCPQDLLPEELQNSNPRNIWRTINNKLSQEAVS